VGALVARYIRHQDGLDFSPGKSGRYRSLVKHVHASLDREAFEQNVHAETPEARTLRAFCRSRGLPLAHRPEADYGRKGTALAEALQLAASRERAPRSITLITDFHGVVNTDALRRTVQLLQAHGHALTVLMLTSRPETALEAAVHGRTEARQLGEARAFFGRLGVPLRVSDGADAASALAYASPSGRLAS
jgi:transposase-like protein